MQRFQEKISANTFVIYNNVIVGGSNLSASFDSYTWVLQSGIVGSPANASNTNIASVTLNSVNSWEITLNEDILGNVTVPQFDAVIDDSTVVVFDSTYPGLGNVTINGVNTLQPDWAITSFELDSAAALIQANFKFLRQQTQAYIDTIMPYVSYDKAKSYRDLGTIINALLFDIVQGGRTKTRERKNGANPN